MTETNSAPDWNFHPERDAITAETHARPASAISSPAEVLHLAFRCEEAVAYKFFEIVEGQKFESFPRHLTGMVDKLKVKLERHTEFMSCTVFLELEGRKDQGDIASMVFDAFPVAEVEILVLLHLSLVRSASAMLKIMPLDQRIYGGRMRSGIDVRSTFVPDESGAIRFSLFGKSLTSEEFGRRLQRILEMETYRTMSLLGLPVARRVGIELSTVEEELEELTTSLQQNNNSTPEEDEKVFANLSDLSEKTNMLLTETRYRFAASRAYFALFQQRVESLEEEKVGDVQTMSGFLRSRLEPAMATIESTAKRQETLTNDLSRALLLLRTRIELNLNKGNQALLQSMDKRHLQQLKISQTVEGLSVVAITYYAVGLISYLLKALAKQAWMPLSATMLTAISVPFVLLIVWRSLHRLRKAWEEHRSS